jgi:hypothetical protein
VEYIWLCTSPLPLAAQGPVSQDLPLGGPLARNQICLFLFLAFFNSCLVNKGNIPLAHLFSFFKTPRSYVGYLEHQQPQRYVAPPHNEAPACMFSARCDGECDGCDGGIRSIWSLTSSGITNWFWCVVDCSPADRPLQLVVYSIFSIIVSKKKIPRNLWILM